MEIIVGDSPSGSAHAKIANRHGQWSKLEQRLDLSQDDIGVTLSCSFHVKVPKFRSKLSDLFELKLLTKNLFRRTIKHQTGYQLTYQH